MPLNIMTLAHTAPVRVEISDAVHAAHDEQVARNKTPTPLSVPGAIRWSVEMGKFEFIPEESAAGDSILDRIRMTESYLGIKASISL